MGERRALPFDSIGQDTPIRLDLAAQLAFPAGGMTAAGLRTEARKGRLVVSKMAGKDFTTLRDVGEMVKLCQMRKESVYGSAPRATDDKPSGSSETENARRALAAARESVKRLSDSSRPTSPRTTSPSVAAPVIPIRSRSLT